MSEYKKSGTKILSTIIIPVGEGIRSVHIQADEFATQMAKGNCDQAVAEAYFKRLAQGAIEWHRLNGLTLVGLKTITYTAEKPKDAKLLMTPNTEVWNTLLKKSIGVQPVATQKLWQCVESEECACSYCTEMTADVNTCEDPVSPP